MLNFALLYVAAILAAPADPPAPPATGVPTPTGGAWHGPLTVTATVDAAGRPVAAGTPAPAKARTATGDVWLYVPKGATPESIAGRPLVLALHGWDHSPALFIAKSTLAALADQHGVVVAIPDTGRTIFETSLYKQTRGKWKEKAGAPWVAEVVLPFLRERYGVGVERTKTAVVGYSTGGRGAVLLAELYPAFVVAGSVSGTYDLMGLDPKIGEYRIHAIIYGARDKYPERWTRDDVMAPDNLARLAGVHLVVAHGDADKSVPYAQLVAFRGALERTPVASKIVLTTPGGGHDWDVWNAAWGPMFEAFAAALGGAR